MGTNVNRFGLVKNSNENIFKVKQKSPHYFLQSTCHNSEKVCFLSGYLYKQITCGLFILQGHIQSA